MIEREREREREREIEMVTMMMVMMIDDVVEREWFNQGVGGGIGRLIPNATGCLYLTLHNYT